MIFKGLNSISEDSYFIKLTDHENAYVHPVGEITSTEDAFLVKEGLKGAGIFNKANAERFIQESEADNLELVSVRSVLGTDETLN